METVLKAGPVVTKRDGREVFFDKGKIEKAVLKAARSRTRKPLDIETQKLAASIAVDIFDKVADKETVDIEYIQDLVIEYLQKNDEELSLLYKEYREARTRARESHSEMMDYSMRILKTGDETNQNGNVDGYSFGGKAGSITDYIMTKIALEKLVSPTTKYNHINNISYLHDKSHYALGDPNCINANLDYILSHGFEVKQTDVRPAQSCSTACQLFVVWFQLQSLGQFGGIGATHLDHTMVPYIRKSMEKHYFIAWLFEQEDVFDDVDIIALETETYEEKLPSGLYIVRSKLDDFIDQHKQLFYEKTGLKSEDFRFDNMAKLGKRLFNKAVYNTIREVRQAVEGMFHNLNTLQSRSGNQLEWRLVA